MDSWKSFSFSLNCDFQKRSPKGFDLLLLSKQAKMTDESSLHFIELRLSKKITKRVRLARALKTSLNHSQKSFSFYWIATFKKAHQKGQAGLGCENKIKFTVESLFHFHWIATFRKSVKAKPKWKLKVLFIFVELQLSKNVI